MHIMGDMAPESTTVCVGYKRVWKSPWETISLRWRAGPFNATPQLVNSGSRSVLYAKLHHIFLAKSHSKCIGAATCGEEAGN